MKALFTTVFSLLFICGFQAQNKDTGLNFDGVDDYVKIPHHNSLNLGRSPFTIEALIRADPANSGTLAPAILSKKADGSASTDGFIFGLTDTGKLAIQIEGQSFTPGYGGSGYGVKAADLRDGQCHHFAWTRETNGVQDTLNGYQDGQYVRKTRKAAGQLDMVNDDDLWIGWSDFNPQPDIYQFMGVIKEIRIWNYARTEAEIYAGKTKHMTGNESGLIAYWRLSENTGTGATDCGPNGNNGLVIGASWMMYCSPFMDAIPAGCSIAPPPIGIDDVTGNSSLEIYPNPVSNSIRLSGINDQKIDQIRIYEITGRQVMLQNWNGQDELNVSHLNSGMYIIELSLEGNTVFESRLSKN